MASGQCKCAGRCTQWIGGLGWLRQAPGRGPALRPALVQELATLTQAGTWCIFCKQRQQRQPAQPLLNIMTFEELTGDQKTDR